MLVYVVSFELVQDNQHKQFQKDLLPEEHEGKPKEEVEGRGTFASTALCIPLSSSKKHEEIPILAWKIDKKCLHGVVKVLIIENFGHCTWIVSGEITHQVGGQDATYEKIQH